MDSKTRLSAARRLAYALAAALIFIILAEAGLALSGKGKVFAPFDCKESGGALECSYVFNARIKPIQVPKPKDLKRVLVMGESAANGYPFEGAGFPEMARAMLEPTEGGRLEIVNLAVNGVNTAFQRETLEDAVPLLEPDAVVIYAGNNEILAYERINDLTHPVLSRAVWWLRRRSRIYNLPIQFMARLMEKGLAVSLMRDVARMESESGKWLNPPAKRDLARRLYLLRVSQMIEVARSGGAAVFLATPGSNLAGWAPMKSAHSKGLSDIELDKLEADLEKVRNLLQNQDPIAAAAMGKEITRADPDWAKAWFFLGKADLMAGDRNGAVENLETAVERADFFQQTPPSYNEGLRAMAREERIPLIDVDRELRESSGASLPGFDLFMDGCHPTLNCNYLIAGMVAQGLADAGLAQTPDPAPSLDEVKKKLEFSEKYAGLSYFNQACVLAFIYRYPEYYAPALDYMEKAVELGQNKSIVGAYQGYLAILIGRPGPAADYFTAARRADEMKFMALINGNLSAGTAIIDGRLLTRAVEGDALSSMYPGSSQPKTPSPDASRYDYAFAWDGKRYTVINEP